MLKIESLLSFTAVVEKGSITAAAEAKGQTPMAVSKQISNLESQVGQALFERTQKRLVLTDFGKEFQQHIAPLLSQHESVESWLTDREGKVQGALRIVAQSPEMINETIIPWINEFMTTYPDLELELDIKKNRISLPEDHYDIYWGIGDYLGEFHPGLKRRFLWSGEYGIFASPAYLEQHPPITQIEQLVEHQIIGYLYNEPANVLLTQDPDDKEKFSHHLLPCRLKTVSGLIELAIAGMGLINADEQIPAIKKALLKGELVPVLKSHWWQSAAIYAYFHNTTPISPKVRAFLDFYLAKVDDWAKEADHH